MSIVVRGQKIPTWALGALGAGVAGLVGGLTYVLLPETKPAQLCRGWVNPAAPAQIHALAKPIERITNLDGLGDFLSGVAWIESRGNPLAGSDSGNAARGMYGMRPESARVYDLGMNGGALKDLPTATALAAWYIHRCLVYADPGQVIDWLALRRCWGYPSDLDDTDHPGYWSQFASGLTCAGINPAFMYETAIKGDYEWPGIDEVLDVVGRSRNLAVAA